MHSYKVVIEFRDGGQYAFEIRAGANFYPKGYDGKDITACIARGLTDGGYTVKVYEHKETVERISNG